jgi:hypothetical protein
MNCKTLRISDEDNELDVFININNKLVLRITPIECLNEDDFSLIVLDESDTIELIRELKKL